MNAMAKPLSWSAFDGTAPWDDRRHRLEVVAVNDEAPGVKTFTFVSDTPAWFRYKPGQFVTLELPAGPEPLMRTYTLSSSPSRPFSVAVTAKAQPGSIGTRWMFDNLRPGMRVKAHGPAGAFSLHDHPAAKYLFVSAGSGVTPMMSMLRWLGDCAPAADVAFLNCARRPEEIIFRRELELLARRMPGLALGFLVEERSRGEAWSGLTGRIDGARLTLLSPDVHEREVFCCGPEPFMDAVRAILEGAGFDMRRYHQESFGGPPATAGSPAPAEEHDAGSGRPAPAALPVRFALAGVEVACPAGRTVLEAARAAGVRIPAACESGLCGTCKIRKLSGEVAMSHNGGILDHEVEGGFILACCSRPLGAVEVAA